jgi:hypothetical protein
MFSADLSWTDPDTEKVGERKQRIAREKEKERSLSSAAPSVRSGKSSTTSVPDDRELWWTSGLKKAKNIRPLKKPRPGTSRSAEHAKRTSSLLPQQLESDTLNDLRDPTLQPSWTYSTMLSAKLPSGAQLDPPEYDVPELEGDVSSRGTNSSGSRSSSKYRKCKHYNVILD